MDLGLKGKIVIVTGGAAGIGGGVFERGLHGPIIQSRTPRQQEEQDQRGEIESDHLGD